MRLDEWGRVEPKRGYKALVEKPVLKAHHCVNSGLNRDHDVSRDLVGA